MSPPVVIEHSHGWALVVLSYLIASLASFTALDAAERVERSVGAARRLWLGAAAVVLGGGIWAMHFIGMLAFQVDLPVSYDAGETILSAVIAILFVAAGFTIVSRNTHSTRRLILAGTIVGIGVAAMHYTGMTALRLPAHTYYDPLLFAASILIAIVAATAALWLAFNWVTTWQKMAAAALMGAAICGMHYTGMDGLIIVPDPFINMAADTFNRPLLTIAVTGTTLALLCVSLLSALVDRRFEARAAHDEAKLRAANVELQAEIAERLTAEQRLRDAHAELEERVIDRTRALAAANNRLEESALALDGARSNAEREKDRAESANRAKSDFLARISHELRTPLNSVLGFAQLLEMNVKEPLSARQTRQVAQIRKSGNHLLALIDEILDLSKIEAGTIRISIERVPLGSVFEQLRETLQPLADSAGIRLSVELSAAAKAVRGDRVRLMQILMNLGGNAIKYTPRGGNVTIIAGMSSDATIRFSVVDSGIGIALERQAEVFQPFNRLGAEETAIEGTGIGLAISHRLTGLMQGTISFQSEPGKGSTFWLDLPIWVGEVHDVDGADRGGDDALMHLSRQEKLHTLLYVEDNPPNIALMQELVDSIPNLRLLTASDPNTGIALAHAHRPDIIVLDINLPGMDGFEVLKRLKRGERTRSIPVMALTAAAQPQDVERGKQSGFTHYLTKPIDVQQFLTALDENLDRTKDGV